MNPNYYNQDYNYNSNMGMGFPSLNQANANNYSGTLPQGLGLQRGGSNIGFDNSNYGNSNLYRANSNSSGPSLTSKSKLKLTSASTDFVPTSSMSTNFFGGSGNNQMSQQQSHSNFYAPQSNYPSTTNKNIQHSHSTTPPLQQMGTQMTHPQYPPNIYPQQQQQSTQQHYVQNPGFQQHPSYYGGSNFLPSYQSSSNSLNSSISTDYSETNEKEFEKVIEYIANLKYPEKREEALQELSKKRESFPKLAVYLWHSVGTLAILLQEIVAIYPLLSPLTLSQQVSCKVCNVLGLLQCLALHPETRSLFLNAHIPLFLYPFLNTSSKAKPFENLRVTSLGVIGALVKGDDSDAIIFLMQTEIIPLCLRIMKRGQELSRTVATFIVQKILLDDNGLSYICQTAERFYAVCTVLNHMVTDVVTNSKDDQRLLRHVVRCYLRLSENPKAKEALRKNLPEPLKELDQKLISDEAVRKSHYQLLQSLGILSE